MIMSWVEQACPESEYGVTFRALGSYPELRYTYVAVLWAGHIVPLRFVMSI